MVGEISVLGLGKNDSTGVQRGHSFFVIITFILSVIISSFASARTGTPVVNVSASSLYFGYYGVGSTGGSENLYVTNSGTTTLTITSITLAGGNSSDFSQTNGCGKSLAAKTNCLVQIKFKPSAAGTRTTTLYLTDNASGSPQRVTLSGKGKAATAMVSLSATSLSFGSYAIGTTSGSANVVVTNSGSTSVSITSITLTDGNFGDFSQTNNCGTSLAIGANCLVQVMFKPSVAGTRATTLNVADNATGSPQHVTLSGTATGTAVVNLSASSLTFPAQAAGTTSAAQAVNLTNTGNAALAVSSIVVSGANASEFIQTNNCGSSVTAGASCTINVTFKPSETGNRGASLAIADNAIGTPQCVALSGTGTNTSGSASLSPGRLTFGNEPVELTSNAQTITLANTGATALNISGFAVTGANSSDFVQNNNCGSSVAVGATCTIAVLFTPSVAGTRAAAITISDDATGSPQTASLSGTGGHDVVLKWTASLSSNVIGYNIYRGTISGGESPAPLNGTPINASTYADENVTAGATYYYLVTSVVTDGVTESAASTETAATVPSI